MINEGLEKEGIGSWGFYDSYIIVSVIKLLI
jgi:hypothetical protein